jgi:metal-responsive CopG/Arc/MetJ family transcriptional regulator
MKNVQVTIDTSTLAAVDRAARPLGLKRSAVVREALRDWLRRQAVEQFERQWIARLQTHPDDERRAADWLAAQAWSRK